MRAIDRCKARLSGYTIIEVMIFLAISLLLFVSAMVAIGGQQAHTEFKTAYNDVNTKFQQWIDEVVNGYSASSAGPVPSNLDCITGSGYNGLSPRPQLQQVAAGTGQQRGANADCIFLGKAIQVTDEDSCPCPTTQDSNKIYAYTVLGLRLNGSNDLSSTLTEANPEPAIDPSIPPGPTDLTEVYSIPNSARVKWVESGSSLSSLGPPGTGSHLAGFFTSFSNGNGSTQNGSQSLLAVQYPMTQNRDPRDKLTINCIELLLACGPLGPDPANPWPMGQWVVCLESTRNDDTAAIYIGSTAGDGATTKVVVPCP